MSLDTAGVDFKIYLDEFRKDMAEIKEGLGGIGKTAKNEADKMDSMFKKATGAMAGYFSAQALIGFGKELISVRGEFEKFEAVLTNSLGSEKEAAAAMKDIADFAAKTPFQLNELTNSYVKLVNQGFKPSMAEMENLGDLAASTGKSFDQLTEGIQDMMVGENERMKEFGLRSEKHGDIIKYTFKGVTTEVKNNADAIKAYVLGLGDLEGVKGSMEAISKTIPGMISNLQDSIDQMFNDMGENAEDVIKDIIGWTAKLVENWELVVAALKVVVAAYGAYKAATIVTSIINQANAVGSLTKMLKQSAIAQKALNMVQAASPIGLIVAAITAAAAAFAIYNKRAKDAAESQSAYNVFLKESLELLQSFAAIKDKYSVLRTMDENQLKKIKNDIVTQLESEKDYNQKLLIELKKRLDKDIELKKLNAKMTSDIYTDIQKAGIQNLIKLRKEEIASDLQAEADKHNENRKMLKNYLTDVEKALSVFDSKKIGVKTIKDLEKELSELERKRKEATDISDKKELDRLAKLIIEKQKEIEKFKIDSKNETEFERFKKDLDEQKKEYQEYEAVKTEISEAEADKLYASLIAKAGTYKLYLEKLLTGNLSKDKTGLVALELQGVTKKDDASQAKATDKAKEDAEAYYKQLFEDTKTNEEKLYDLKEKYRNDLFLLDQQFRAATTDGEKQKLALHGEILDEQYQSAKFAIEKENDLYAWLFSSIENYSRKELQNYIDRINKELQVADMPEEKRIEMLKALAEAQELIDNKLAKGLSDAAMILGDLAGLAGVFNDELAKGLQTASELAGAAGSIAAGIASGNPIQVVSGIIQGFTTVAKIGKSIFSNEKELAQIEKDRLAMVKQHAMWMQTQNDILQRQIELMNQLDGMARNERFVKTLSNINRQLDELNSQVYNDRATSERGGIFLLQETGAKDAYDHMQALLAVGAKFDEETYNRITDNFNKYNELLAIRAQIISEQQEYVTGTTVSTLSDEITQMFLDAQLAGKDFTEEFGDNFEKVMQKALLTQFQNRIVADAIDKWYADLAFAMDDKQGLTDAESEALMLEWQTMMEDMDKEWQMLAEKFPEFFTPDKKEPDPDPTITPDPAEVVESISPTIASLSNEITQMFLDAQLAGEDFTEAFGDNFEKVMQKALLTQFQNRIVADAIEKWYTGLEASMNDKDGLTAEESAALNNEWQTMMEGMDEQWKVMANSFPDFFSANNTDNPAATQAPDISKKSTAGAIQNIQESTANILSGHVGNIRVNVATLVSNASKHLEILNSMDGKLGNIEKYTRETRDALQNSGF